MFDVFGELFDFDNNGSLDVTERAAELGFVDEIIDDDEYTGEDDETD